MTDLTDSTLESLEVGAAPLVLHFLRRLQLPTLFQRFLPPAPTGAPEKIPSALTLSVLVSHFLLARRPLDALPDWCARYVPEHLGLSQEQLALLNDDRFGRALEHLFAAEGASLLTALIHHTVREFVIELQQFHNDSTSISFAGDYTQQADPQEEDRPPLLTQGYNKDHRPDLKQLVYCLTVSADGAVPIHFKTYDGNTPDDTTHRETWLFLCKLVGHANFLYVADSKLCSHDNLSFIAGKQGRFLTVMPRTWKETQWLHRRAQEETINWQVVRRQRQRRANREPENVYEGAECPQPSADGYRLFWYRSSQKRIDEAAHRERLLTRFWSWQPAFQVSAKRNRFASEAEALAKGRELLQEKGVSGWVVLRAVPCERRWQEQEGRGRPGPNTTYVEREETYYELVFGEDKEALAAAAKCDGLFCLLSNDKNLSVCEALAKYKYQPFLEKRYEQLKTVFGVMPVWLKKPERIAGLLMVYFVVLLVQALIEREVRQRMKEKEIKSLALYPEQRATKAPTTELVFAALEGHRRHRLLDSRDEVLRTFHDPLSDVGLQVLQLLDVELAAYGRD